MKISYWHYRRPPQVFDDAAALGFRMDLMDIGGGFTGHFDECGNVMFGEIATTINAALATYFPPDLLPHEVRGRRLGVQH